MLSSIGVGDDVAAAAVESSATAASITIRGGCAGGGGCCSRPVLLARSAMGHQGRKRGALKATSCERWLFAFMSLCVCVCSVGFTSVFSSLLLQSAMLLDFD